MINHTHTQNMEINFTNLEDRIMQINDPIKGQYNVVKKLLENILINGKPTLIMATGGSKIVAFYLKLVLEQLGSLNQVIEVIEPRDYFYKQNIDAFANLVVISASGRTNGIKDALNDFQGSKYLICENPQSIDCSIVAWGNELYQKEKSFISLADTLGPISLLLDITSSKDLQVSPKIVEKTNKKIRELFIRCQQKISEIDTNFRDDTFFQIISGYDTFSASATLESALTESGIGYPIIHDKGSFCHGRSNLLFNQPESRVIYLSHDLRKLDRTILCLIRSKYPNLSTFNSKDIKGCILWKEYYLILQMYYLAKKIASDKGMDLTMPEYDQQIIRTLYNFKGEM